MRIRALAMIAFAICLVSHTSANAQFTKKEPPDRTIDAKAAAKLVEEIGKSLREAYVFPETAEKMSQDLRDHLEKKEYDKITSAKELAQTLTEQLQAVSKDKHLRVIYTYSAAPPALMKEDGKPDFQKQKEMLAKMKAQGTAMNFGRRSPRGVLP